MTTRPVIILGAGGHARVLLNVLKILNISILGVTDVQLKKNHFFEGFPVLGADEVILDYPCEEIFLVNGLGSTYSNDKRRSVFERFKALGYSFENIIHPSVLLAEDVEHCEGVQIMAGAIIQPHVHIGKNVLINTGVIIDHDCTIGDHAHIATGAALAGNVKVGEDTHIGCGVVVIHGVSIGSNSLIGAGAAVVNHISNNVRALGVPARVFVQKEKEHA